MKIQIGKKYLHHTFAGVKVVSKIIDETAPDIFMGHLIRKQDIKNLKKAGVAYKGDEKPSNCVGVVYPFQVIRKWTA
jgi:hypothetical protein